MALNIRPSTSIERRLIFIETLLNMTDKVSKISDNSVLSGIASGVSKVAGKAEKDIILSISQLFPDSAASESLDQCAINFGIPPRLGSTGSSVYVRLVADPGTTYTDGVHKFISNSGQIFDLEAPVSIGQSGYEYAKLASVSTGLATNVEPLSINQVTPVPTGHRYVINESSAVGGRDDESDELFRIRIKEGANILAKGTLAMIEQLFILINPKVLKVFHHGINAEGKIVLAISTQNGADLTSVELNDLLSLSAPFFGLSEYKPFGKTWYGIELKNIQYQPVDISFRVELDNSFNIDDIRQNIQIQISKYFDFRFFNPLKDKIEWDNLLQIVKSTPGVKYVPDQFFSPKIDIPVALDKLPRLRGFLMLDKNGTVIQNISGTLQPVYYPNEADFIYTNTILGNII